MKLIIEKFRASAMLQRTMALLLSFGVGCAVLAAAVFLANNQPWGYIAPPALSGSNFKKNNVYAYTPWFEIGTFRGDLIAFPVGADGAVAILSPDWRASVSLDGQHYLTGRHIATTNGAGVGIPFLFDSLTPLQQTMVGSVALLNFVRGDRSNEGEAGMRIRSGVLGDIVHSGPVYVGRPTAGYLFGDYLDEFANANANRAGRVYVGANDGMLHAFDVTDGHEVFAYVPSMVMPNLKKLAEQNYSHQYFVDGFLTVEDAQFGDDWHSVLVGGLGAGGKGYYGLDVTNPDAASDTDAASKILWEFHVGSTGASNLGYSFSRPSIVRLDNNDNWGAIVGNGYLSANGEASLIVLDLQTGAVIKEIVVNGGADNGLSSPTAVDSNGDGIVDAVYAGDLNGNLWKFDLGPSGPASWGIAYSGWPLFRTTAGQPITTAPEVGQHPTGTGLMVYIGTGQLFSNADGMDKTTQAVYGLWDDGASVSLASLVQQQLSSQTHSSGAQVRVITDNRPDWTTNSGWMVPIEIGSASPLDKGERVLQDLLLRDGRITFMSVNPTIGTGDNWLIQLDATTGGAPSKTIFDVNEDNILNVSDNVDGDGNGTVDDVRRDRVVAQYQFFGLASRPVVGIIGTAKDSALINHLTAIPPNQIFDADDPGLLGGHFDLDTASSLYPFGDGDTDGHVHEWDDKHDLTTINFMDLVDGKGKPLFEINNATKGVDPNSIFMLSVANTELSPGGVLEINGTSMSVSRYREILDRYVQGNNDPDEVFPRFKLNQPTATEAAAGVQQLFSLKLSFDAYAILSGDLIPTETGCVRGNDPGPQGQYRNGALMLQALDASNVGAGFTHDENIGQYVAGSTALHATLGYATKGMFWESTVFWHWKNGCYGDSSWDGAYQSCIIAGSGDCFDVSGDKKDKSKKKKKKKKKDDDDVADIPADGDPPVYGVELNPDHNITNTTIGGSNDTGRLFWKELIPEE